MWHCELDLVHYINIDNIIDYNAYNILVSTVSPRGHLFYVDFLIFIFTSHRGGNVSTAVRTFPPR